ncbi:MAG: glycosyltransferase family 4 protein [Burkholderiales bacterium]
MNISEINLYDPVESNSASIRRLLRVSTEQALRICVVTETFPPEINGVAHSIARFCDGLLARGVDLQIVRPRQPADSPPWRCAQAQHLLVDGFGLPNYPAVRLGVPSMRLLMRQWRIDPPDVVHIVTEGPLGWSALRSARKLNIPVTSSFHTNFQGYAAYYGARLLAKTVMAYLRYFHNRTQRTIVPTRQLRDELTAQGFRGLAVVGRGVDIERFNPRHRSEELRAKLNIGESAPMVLHVGRLAPEKNLGVLFEAFEQIRQARPDARLVLVGDGPERERLAREHPRCHFAGMLTGEPLAQHFASADLFLFPSLTETFGNVTLEAMASGLAVVAFDYAATREHIRHMENGVSVPFGDARSFAEMAALIARNPTRMNMLRCQARASAELLGWEGIYDQFVDVLARVAGERGAVAAAAPAQMAATA